MGIDRIGQGGPPVPVPDTGAPSQATPTGATFHVERAEPAALEHVAASGAAEAQAARTPLQRLQAGELDLGGYVDLKVDEATSHLRELPASQLDAIRGALRERLASDPSLVELLHTATGQTLPADDRRDD
jgi:hypothetical protein